MITKSVKGEVDFDCNGCGRGVVMWHAPMMSEDGKCQLYVCQHCGYRNERKYIGKFDVFNQEFVIY